MFVEDATLFSYRYSSLLNFFDVFDLFSLLCKVLPRCVVCFPFLHILNILPITSRSLAGHQTASKEGSTHVHCSHHIPSSVCDAYYVYSDCNESYCRPIKRFDSRELNTVKAIKFDKKSIK